MDTSPDRPPPPRPAARQPVGALLTGWLRWFGVGRLIATAIAVVAVVAGGFWLLRTPPTAVESTLPYAASTTAAAVGPSAPNTTGNATLPDDAAASSTAAPNADPVAPVAIVVYVAGAVVVPGVYTLPGDARVDGAVLAAGGLTADADVDAVNLAGFLTDGSRVYVPRIGVPVPSVVTPSGGGNVGDVVAGAGKPVAPALSGPVDLNTATAEMLDELPGIGPSTAAAIVAHRENSGPFAAVEDLLDVRGIGPAKLDAIRSLITV